MNGSNSHFTYWKLRVVMMPTLLLLVAPEVLVISDKSCHNANFFITGALAQCHQWWQSWRYDNSCILLHCKSCHKSSLTLSKLQNYLFIYIYIWSIIGLHKFVINPMAKPLSKPMLISHSEDTLKLFNVNHLKNQKQECFHTCFQVLKW